MPQKKKLTLLVGKGGTKVKRTFLSSFKSFLFSALWTTQSTHTWCQTGFCYCDGRGVFLRSEHLICVKKIPFVFFYNFKSWIVVQNSTWRKLFKNLGKQRRSPRIKFGFIILYQLQAAINSLMAFPCPSSDPYKEHGILNSLVSARFKMFFIRIWSYTLNCFPYYRQGASLCSTIFDHLLYILELWILNISGVLKQNQTECFNQPY